MLLQMFGAVPYRAKKVRVIGFVGAGQWSRAQAAGTRRNPFCKKGKPKR